jgi:hypothetical protein
LQTDCLIEHVIEGTLEGMGRRGRIRKQLLDDHMEMRIYWNFKEAALDHILWITHFGTGYGHDDKGHVFALVVGLRKEGGDRMHAEAALANAGVLTIKFCFVLINRHL